MYCSARCGGADGTYLNTLCDVAWALHHHKPNGRRQGQVRANVQMNVANWVPQVVTVSGDDAQSEPAAFVPGVLRNLRYVERRDRAHETPLLSGLVLAIDF